MFRATVAVLLSCTLLTTTVRQYMALPGHPPGDEGGIIEVAFPLLREGGLHNAPRELVIITGTSSVFVVAFAMIDALAF